MKRLSSKVVAVTLCISMMISTCTTSFAASEEEYVSGIYVTYAEKTKDKSALQVAKDQFKTMFEDESRFEKGTKYEVLAQNFNKGADSAFSSSQPVYIAITKTTDKNEAIRDISAMNMDGGYTFADYETILQQKYDDYYELGRDEATLIEEFREKYSAGSDQAKFAYEQLNRFREDDSDKLLGDYLLECPLLYTDEERAALESEGKTNVDPIVMFLSQVTNSFLSQINALLAISVTSAKDDTTFDRLSKLSADEIAAYQEDPQYFDEAAAIIPEIKTMISSMDETLEKAKENSEKEEPLDVDDLFTADESVYYAMAAFLQSIAYEDASLFDLFAKEDLKAKDLYPLLGVISNGQRSAIKLTGIEAFLKSELTATQEDAKEVLDDGVKRVEEENADEVSEALVQLTEEEDKIIEETGEDVNEDVDMGSDDVTEIISVYTGVDRTLLNKSLAFTTDAQRAEESHKGYTILQGDTIRTARIALFTAFIASAITCATSAALYAHYARNLTHMPVIETSIRTVHLRAYNYQPGGLTSFLPWNASKEFQAMENLSVSKTMSWDVGELAEWQEFADKSAYYSGVFGVVFWAALGVTMLAAGGYGIAETYAYYHPSKKNFSPRPEGMLDVGLDEKGNRKTIMYSGVYDTNGEIADINGWVSRNWVALYTTKDPDAGNPILADATYDSDAANLEGLSVVHLFGQSDAMSFNDYAFKTTTKIYLGFSFEEDDDNSLIASILTGTSGYVAAGIGGALMGFALGSIVVLLIRRKQENETLDNETITGE